MKKILLKLISAVLVVTTLIGTSQLALVTVFADETTDVNSETAFESAETVEPEEKLSPSQAIEKEMAERPKITKDRSAGANTGDDFAVYVNDALYDSGEFSDMWNLALNLAAMVVVADASSNNDRYDNVEFVMYKDLRYDSSWFGEKTMTVSNRKLTIDLNGHLLHRYDRGGSVIRVTDNSILTIMDSNPTRVIPGYFDSNKMWTPSYFGGGNTIDGGVISGGYHKTSDGGGLFVTGKSTVYITGGTIAGNKADIGSAVYLEDHSTLDMSKGSSQICYNYSAGTLDDGGAIFLRGDCTVKGGYVHDNIADDYGGGIKAKGDNILIKDVVVFRNTAYDYGGGMYIERRATGQVVTVSGCRIVGNFTGEDGGGVYIYDLNKVKMNDCTIEENLAGDDGGGICLSSWTGTHLEISGKMVVRNNTASYGKKNINSNLYLEGNDKLIVGDMSIESEVWIRTKTAASSYNGVKKRITLSETKASSVYFYADEEGYSVRYQDDPAKTNFRHLYLAEGEKTEHGVMKITDYSPKQLATPYTIETGDHAGETAPVLKGYFEFAMMTNLEYLSASPFYYSDGYFFEDPTVYNKHLATMSISAAISAFGRGTTHVGDNAYANHFANVKQLFADIGCYESNFYVNQDYQMKPAYYGEDGRLTTIGVAISQKEIKVGDDSYTLVPIAIRGDGYEVEWASNLTVGEFGESKGFADAADQVYKHVQTYIQNYGLTEKVANGKVKFWVVGYSRAGATANLTSKRLIDNYAQIGNQIYGYTFEAPMGGVDSAKLKEAHTDYGKYPTIHNTVNELDFVTLVVPTEMGFIRYGVDHLIGSTGGANGLGHDENDAYYQQRMLMIDQLAAINPYYCFDDAWYPTCINLTVGSMISSGVMSTNYGNGYCNSMYVFLRWFFDMFQEYGLDRVGTNSTITNREAYAASRPLGDTSYYATDFSDPNYNFGYSSMTVEQAASSLIRLVMNSLTDEQFNELFEALTNKAPSLANEYLGIDSNLAATGMLPVILSALFSNFIDLYGVASTFVFNWDETTPLKKSENINWLVHKILDPEPGKKSVWDVLDDDQAAMFAEALPVMLWVVLNYVSYDYKSSGPTAKMWGVPTFIKNASSIISNHYPEITLAWVRSYDDFYDNDLQAYTLDTSKLVFDEPVGLYVSTTHTLTISGQNGSSIFYSLDEGNSWILYTKPVWLENPGKILYFSILHGVKSSVREAEVSNWAGSIFNSGSVWAIIAISAVAVGTGAVVYGVRKKKKKATAE